MDMKKGEYAIISDEMDRLIGGLSGLSRNRIYYNSFAIKRRSRSSGWIMMIKSIIYWIRDSKRESNIIEKRICKALVAWWFSLQVFYHVNKKLKEIRNEI